MPSLHQLSSLRYLLSKAFPTMVVLLLQSSLSMLEMVYVTRLGSDAATGVALIIPLLLLMTTMSAAGIGGGVAASMAFSMGKQTWVESRRILWHALLLGLVLGSCFLGLVYITSGFWFDAMAIRPEVLVHAKTYLYTVGWSVIPMWVFNLLAGALRGAGEVGLPARVTMVSVVILLLLNPLLIFGWGFIPSLGVMGAGVALTLYYGFASLMLILRLIVRKNTELTLTPMPYHHGTTQAILSVGGLSAVGTFLSSLVTWGITMTMSQYHYLSGESPLLGYTVASRLDMLLIPLMFGLGSALTSVIGMARGVQAFKLIKQISQKVLLLVLVFGSVLGLLIHYMPNVWLALFHLEASDKWFAQQYLEIVAPSYGCLCAGLMSYFLGQGLGDMVPSSLGLLIRLVLMLLGYALVAYQHLTFLNLLGLIVLGYVFSAGVPLGLLYRRIKVLEKT
jgi:Na+-driven multidrug efflux pump